MGSESLGGEGDTAVPCSQAAPTSTGVKPPLETQVKPVSEEVRSEEVQALGQAPCSGIYLVVLVFLYLLLGIFQLL